MARLLALNGSAFKGLRPACEPFSPRPVTALARNGLSTTMAVDGAVVPGPLLGGGGFSLNCGRYADLICDTVGRTDRILDDPERRKALFAANAARIPEAPQFLVQFNHRGRDGQAVILRNEQPAADTSCRFRISRQLRSTAQNPERSHALRVRASSGQKEPQ